MLIPHVSYEHVFFRIFFLALFQVSCSIFYAEVHLTRWKIRGNNHVGDDYGGAGHGMVNSRFCVVTHIYITIVENIIKTRSSSCAIIYYSLRTVYGSAVSEQCGKEKCPGERMKDTHTHTLLYNLFTYSCTNRRYIRKVAKTRK